jgi:archaellum biogenesis protein FlaJ (TadC family)
MFGQKVALMRAKRRLIASTFSFTSLIIHATIAALLVGIYQILLNFSKLLQAADVSKGGMDGLAQLPTFQFFSNSGAQLQMLNFMVTAMLVMLTVVNAFTIKTVEGGSNLKITFYLGLTAIISGLVLLTLPGLLSGIFGSISMK